MSIYYQTTAPAPEGSPFYTALAAYQEAQTEQRVAAVQIANFLADDGEVDPFYVENYRELREKARAAKDAYDVEAAKVR